MAFSTIYPDLGTLLKEDVLDMLVQITPLDKPVMNIIGMDGQASQPFHQWLTQSLSTRNDNAVVEGDSFTFNANSEPTTGTRRLNATQIFRKLIRITGTSQASDRYGVSDQFQRSQREKLLEMSTDIEHALIQGSLASGATAAARRFDGMLWAATLGSNQHTVAATTLTEDVVNDLFQSVWNNGVRPRDVLVGPRFKRTISGFTQGGGSAVVNPARTQFKEQNDLAIVNVVSIYESDFGVAEIHLSRDVPQDLLNTAVDGLTLSDYVVAFDRDMFRMAWLRRPFSEPTAKTADSMDAVMIGEGTLEYGDPSGFGWYQARHTG